MNETIERSNYTLLVIDDDIDTIMRWFIQRLKAGGFRVRPCRFFADAVTWLQEHAATEEEIDGVILDIMLSLRKADEEAYNKVEGHKPRGATDAMQAGLTLLPLIRKSLPGVPIFVLTSLPADTEIGRTVYGKLEKISDVRYIQRKPADDNFFKFMLELLAKHKGQEEET